MPMIPSIAFNEAISFMSISNLTNEIVNTDSLATPEKDASVLYKIIASIKPEFILEIGTFYGHITYGFSVNSPQSKIFTIDICKEMGIKVPEHQEIETLEKEKVGMIFKNKNTNITQIFGDSRRFSTYKGLPHFDFVFIDGNHSRESIISDTKNIFNKTRQNAVVFWHDYKDDGFVETKIALNELTKKNKIKVFHIKNTGLAFTIKNGNCGFGTERIRLDCVRNEPQSEPFVGQAR
jgi:predicted O-methyltransferase YrrM